jgi:hypothetical protein
MKKSLLLVLALLFSSPFLPLSAGKMDYLNRKTRSLALKLETYTPSILSYGYLLVPTVAALSICISKHSLHQIETLNTLDTLPNITKTVNFQNNFQKPLVLIGALQVIPTLGLSLLYKANAKNLLSDLKLLFLR